MTIEIKNYAQTNFDSLKMNKRIIGLKYYTTYNGRTSNVLQTVL